MAKPKTQYAKAMKAVRSEEQEKRRNVGSRRHVKAAGGAKCGARKRHGRGTCGLVAGMGTTHPGIGRCKYHGGSTPSGIKNAAVKTAVLLGAPKEINPLDAIIWCIKMTAGEIDFYTEQMALIAETNWIEETIVGQQMHVFARMRAEAQERLVKFSKDAISLGLTERAVRLAEQYGSTISALIKGILDELMPFISDEGQKLLPGIIHRHLLLAEQGQASLNVMASNQTKALEAAA